MSITSSLSPIETANQLARIGKDIDAATAEMSQLDEQVVLWRRKYETKYARVFLTTEGPMEIRKYTARLEAESENFELEMAEQKLRAVMAHIRALRDRLEIGRSVGALLRVEWTNS